MATKYYSKQDICRIFQITDSEFETLKNNPDEMKRRYRRLAKKLHPDTKKPEEQEEYTKKFIEIGEAYDAFAEYSKQQTYSSYTTNYETNSTTNTADSSYYKQSETEQHYQERQTYYNEQAYEQQTEQQAGTEHTYSTYTSYTYTRRYGWDKFWWILFWPARGILYSLGAFFVNLIAWISAVTSIGVFFTVPKTISHAYDYFCNGTSDLSNVIFYAVASGICILSYFFFQFLDWEREDWIDNMWQWWRL